MTATNKIKIIIADDHALLRQGVIDFINEHEHLTVIAEASNGMQLLQLARKLVPDVIITDIFMPEMDGREATRVIAKELPSINIIALTMVDNAFMIADMMKSGAIGYVLKASIKAEIIDAIEAVVKHTVYYCEGATQKMTEALTSENPYQLETIKGMAFTKRQIEIIKLICKGFSSQEIAEKLNLGYRTVENYRSKILLKTGCNNSASLVFYIMQNNLYLP